MLGRERVTPASAKADAFSPFSLHIARVDGEQELKGVDLTLRPGMTAKLAGKVFLSGPYHGAPLSLAVVTPATAGPFDLGSVVVRVALFVDPETVRVRALSDPIPDVFGGAQLSIRSVDVSIDRPSFTLNPTSCDPFATAVPDVPVRLNEHRGG